VDEMTMAYTGARRSAVKTLRLGARRWIKALDTLCQSWLPRADELPLRHEDIGILREMTVEGDLAVLAGVKVYIPKKQLSSSSLRIPNIIYELHGGKLR
ncbi:hypothetical protein DER46DRAFT_518163, partial [Fusarium sp. MPI-SDFR-AT-0072]